MPELVAPAVPKGRLGNQPQPNWSVDGLTIRPWLIGDVDELVAAYRDPEIQRWHVRSMNHAEALEWLAAGPELWRAETRLNWAVTEGDTLVGRIGFRTVDLAEGNAEISYWTVPAARGRGVAVRAVGTVSAWMFETGFHRLELTHSTANAASCRVAEKAGFGYEGTLRQQVQHQDGRHDMHLHARLVTDRPDRPDQTRQPAEAR